MEIYERIYNYHLEPMEVSHESVEWLLFVVLWANVVPESKFKYSNFSSSFSLSSWDAIEVHDPTSDIDWKWSAVGGELNTIQSTIW